MYKVLTKNVIAESGQDVLRRAGIQVAADVTDPDAMLIRSFKLHDAVFGPDLLCIGRAGIGVDNAP